MRRQLGGKLFAKIWYPTRNFEYSEIQTRNTQILTWVRPAPGSVIFGLFPTNIFSNSFSSNFQQVREAFIYSQCEVGSLTDSSTPHACYQNHWKKFLLGNGSHPCSNSTSANSNNLGCCHFWTASLQNNLMAIMKVMRMASGRGNSHFNIDYFLKPFLDNQDLLRYQLTKNPFLINGKG